MDDITTLADLMKVLTKQGITLRSCRIFTTYDGGLSPFAAVGVRARGNRDLLIKFEPFDDVIFHWQVTSLKDVLDLAHQHRLNHRACRLYATIDGDDTVLAVATMSVFNGNDIHLTFKPDTAALSDAGLASDYRRGEQREVGLTL